MPLSVQDRLQYEAAVLRSLEARRIITGNLALHRSVEENIISRELEELADEWRRNPPPMETL